MDPAGMAYYGPVCHVCGGPRHWVGPDRRPALAYRFRVCPTCDLTPAPTRLTRPTEP
jgi:hypothetical protein